MRPFEMNETNDSLRDANDRLIENLPIPNSDMLEQLTVQMINESDAERVRFISNIADEVEEEDEVWKYSDVPTEVTRLTMEKIMIELAGESWLNNDKEDGYSIGEIIEILSRKAFVQLSELTVANIKACLDSGGKLIAYFPDLVWREYFHQLPSLPSEILGMRAVEIERLIDNEGMIINDLSSAEGKRKQLDMASFAWLSKDGWMVEVYK